MKSNLHVGISSPGNFDRVSPLPRVESAVVEDEATSGQDARLVLAKHPWGADDVVVGPLVDFADVVKDCLGPEFLVVHAYRVVCNASEC